MITEEESCNVLTIECVPVTSNFTTIVEASNGLMFAWSYDHNLMLVLYKSIVVFKQFLFFYLLHENETCACTSTTRLRSFCDLLTIIETSNFCKASNMYVQ